MRKRTRQYAFLMSATMLFSSLWGAWGMSAYAAENLPAVTEMSETAENETQDANAAVDEEAGASTVSANVPSEKVTALYSMVSAQDAEEALVEITNRFRMYDKDVSFDPDSEWDDKGEHEVAGITTDYALKSGAYITMDILLPDNASYSEVIKVQGVVKVGDEWKWTEASNIPELAESDFGEASDGFKRASIRFDFGEDIEKGAVKVFIIKLAGYKCNYSGPVYVENIRLYDGAEAEPLPPADDSVIDDFEGCNIGADGSWKDEGGWQYDGGKSIAVEEFDGSKALGVELDYSQNSDVSWSEAKIKKTFDTPYDLSSYNCLVMDFYYPEAFQSAKVKVFSAGVMEADTEVGAGESSQNGYRKAQIAFKFSPTNTPFEDLTIGIVGVNTAFQGKVYIDNIKLTQESAEGDFVEITSVPNEDGTQANTSGAPSSVTLADKDATASTGALYAYLIALKNNNQVLFGHENDINKAVSVTASEGDVKDVTGSLSGIYGLDSLSLTGAELGITDAGAAVAEAASNSIAAAKQGAIVSLSAHMPNFTNSKITQRADGSYDFTGCDFNESKDLSNNCAEQILPGGDYNAQFNAYLDIIADYAKRLQAEDVPILFRPFHENNGSWFWWGSGTSVESYKSIFRYAEEYLQANGVHNMIYVYSPNGPFSDEGRYMERYPGDEYIDILAFDYYDDYNTYPTVSDGSFFAGLNNTCAIVSSLAAAHGKIAAISETGVRAMKENGSDNEGLLVANNPVTQEKTGTNWYQKIADIADDNDMPYYLVWANFGDTNFYVPYKYSDTLGHEMINEFIDFYNNEKTIFANGTNFYGNMGGVSVTAYTNPYGYLIAPFERAAILGATALRGSVANGNTIEFRVVNTDTNQSVTLQAVRKEGSALKEYEALLDEAQLAALGKTDSGVITLLADGVEIASIRNISLGKDKDKAPVHMIDNFDYYAGSDGLLDAAYVENSAAGCSSEFILDSSHKSDGTYGGRFHYVLETTGNEVWTGRVKTLENNDYSAYNALTMWVQPDGMGQKVVVQLADGSGEEFEIYLTEFNKGTEAKYVTIPFSAFQGKNGGTLDASRIMKFAVWCNSIVPDGHAGTWKVDSSIYFDGIQCIKASDELLAQVNGDGLILTDESQAPEEPSDDDDNNNDNNDSNNDDNNNADDNDNSNDNGNGSEDNDGGQEDSSEGSQNNAPSFAGWKTETDYLSFNRVSEQKIKTAEKNGTVVITTLNWVSFHKSVLKALQARPDVTVTINYRYLGKYYTVTIPAGADVSALANKEGFCGFRYLDQVFQGHEINRFREIGIKFPPAVPEVGNKK